MKVCIVRGLDAVSWFAIFPVNDAELTIGPKHREALFPWGYG